MAVPAWVDRHDTVLTAEALELGGKVDVVAAPPVNEEEGQIPAACLFVEERHPGATQLSHSLIGYASLGCVLGLLTA